MLFGNFQRNKIFRLESERIQAKEKSNSQKCESITFIYLHHFHLSNDNQACPEKEAKRGYHH